MTEKTSTKRATIVVIGLVFLTMGIQFEVPLSAQGVADSLVLFDFEGDFDLTSVQAGANKKSVQPHQGSQRLVVETKGDKGGIYLAFGLKSPVDLNGYHHVKVDVTNATDQPAQLIFQVGAPADGIEAWQMQIVADFKAHETKTVVNPITTTPWVFSQPLPLVGMRAAPGQPKTDLAKINRLSMSFGWRNKKQRFIIDNIRATNPVRLVDPTGYLPFVDKFGQYKHADWPGKTLSEDDLRQQRDDEARVLKADSGPDHFNKYGGWVDGPKFEATGFFRPQKHAGVWWLVDPEGYLFWSHGVGVVSSTSATTPITDREDYFQELPDKDTPCGKFYGTADYAAHGYYKGRGERVTFNLTGANLYRKYGPDWQAAFNRRTHASEPGV